MSEAPTTKSERLDMSQHRRSRVIRTGVFAAAAASALILAGCSGSATSGKEPQTISYAFGAIQDQDKAAYTGLATSFEKANKGVTVTLINLPAESYGTAIATRVQGGNAPDTFNAEGGTGQPQSIIPFAKAGLLLPLTDNEIKRNLPENEKYLWTYNGKIYGVPLGTQVNGVIYNDELAKSVGIDITGTTSLDDIIAQCGKARAAGKSVYGLAGSTFQSFPA